MVAVGVLVFGEAHLKENSDLLMVAMEAMVVA
jgi:hypothetical protein